ncbi:alpha/beta hydrolase [Sphingomonas sp. S2-65]|uniref:alpha/beta hydrolase n=1 Tax=Sphingomonas sp. S2-65 TaxID=2903960 RepID=UPI001F323488|nr:alpha/beta hydrolase fold domain-containing protein [Sphingomonas sp. S2-65]UYY59971.1 alpha/beta hydrolase fold domain-containing protein [Sphingomonas sp. S2-65]
MSPPVSRINPEPLRIAPASAHPQLDPAVQSFLDRWEEGAETPARDAPVPDIALIHPAAAERTLPLYLYLEVPSDRAEDRTPALQALADRAGVAVLRHMVPLGADLHTTRAALHQTVERIAADAAQLDPARIAIGGDGLGAAVALAVAANPALPRWPFRLLILATPILGPRTDVSGTAWLTAERAAMLAAYAEPIAADANILPPILVLTAEADPFRDAAEALARRLMADGADVSAIRTIGTIHDFTWLPPLRDAPGSLDAARLMAGALHHRLHACEEKSQSC